MAIDLSHKNQKKMSPRIFWMYLDLDLDLVVKLRGVAEVSNLPLKYYFSTFC